VLQNVLGKKYPFDEIVNGKVESVVIKVDEKKERIKELQSLLNKVYNSGLVVDGIIGQLTNNALKKVILKNYCANDLVKFIQHRLIMNGRGVGNCGADGKYGKDTANAVRKFQQLKGLTVDGIAGINTIKALI
jgi:peptidoglycan hydrolase-like protein with peptidoglycan-binding domain